MEVIGSRSLHSELPYFTCLKRRPQPTSTRGEFYPPLLVGAEMPELVGSLVKVFLSNIGPQQSRFSHLENLYLRL